MGEINKATQELNEKFERMGKRIKKIGEREVLGPREGKVYCKNCRHFDVFVSNGTPDYDSASCKNEVTWIGKDTFVEKGRKEKDYGISPKVKNTNNDCPDYERKFLTSSEQLNLAVVVSLIFLVAVLSFLAGFGV